MYKFIKIKEKEEESSSKVHNFDWDFKPVDFWDPSYRPPDYHREEDFQYLMPKGRRADEKNSIKK